MDLPGLDGLQVIKPLKERFHYVNFLIFSSLNEEVYAISALKIGSLRVFVQNKSIERTQKCNFKNQLWRNLHYKKIS